MEDYLGCIIGQVFANAADAIELKVGSFTREGYVS